MNTTVKLIVALSVLVALLGFAMIGLGAYQMHVYRPCDCKRQFRQQVEVDMLMLLGLNKQPDWEAYNGVIIQFFQENLDHALDSLGGTPFEKAVYDLPVKACWADDVVDDDILEALASTHFDDGTFFKIGEVFSDNNVPLADRIYPDEDLTTRLVVFADGRFYFQIDDDNGGEYDTYELHSLEPSKVDQPYQEDFDRLFPGVSDGS